MPDDYIAVTLELPQLKILWQKETETCIEVVVIYHRGRATCPQCGEVTTKVHDRRPHHTAICDLVKREVMEVVEGQGKQKVEEYLDSLLEPEKVRGVAMDMHEPSRQAVQMYLPLARIVVDKFHLIRHINGDVDKVRTKLQGGNRRGKRRDLFRSRYTLLKGAERLSDWE